MTSLHRADASPRIAISVRNGQARRYFAARSTSAKAGAVEKGSDCRGDGWGYNVVMEQDFARILFTRERIAARVKELARDIAAAYDDKGHSLVIVSVLSGSIIFLADLIRCLPLKMQLGLITVSRYRGATTVGGATDLVVDLRTEIKGKHVLIIDDILDSGGTLRMVVDQLRSRGPASIKVCVLLRKTAKAPKDFTADFVGFDIEDFFVVGYGLDYNDHYRNWPDIGVLRPELYE